MLLLFPLDGLAVSCDGVTISPDHYLMLAPGQPASVEIESLGWPAEQGQLLVLWLSPGFLADIAAFLDIPNNMQELLHGVPLLHGDQVSLLLAELATACRPPADREAAADLLLEIAGEILRLMRLRHQVLLRLAGRKASTISDLLPRLLQACQYLEAAYARPLKIGDVAAYVALSEYHFARLFKAAFDVTVRQYLIRLRLDRARRALARPGSSVTDTALQVGYGSLSSFIHAFSRRYGFSPSQYQVRMWAELENEQDLTSPGRERPL